MMNPFIAALMQQSEQASKEALARQEQQAAGLGLAMGMMGGGVFGGEGLFGGGGGPLAPTEAAFTPPGDVIGPGYRAPTYTPPAPAYTPPVTMADPASQPFTQTPDVPPIAAVPDRTAINETWARNDPGATTPAPLTVNEKWTLNDPGATPQTKAQEVAAAVLGSSPTPTASAPAPSVSGGGVGDEPINMAKYLQWSGRDLGMTPQEYQQEGVAVPDWGYVAPTETAAFGPISWNTDRASLDGVDPSIVQAIEEAANAVNYGVTDGRYLTNAELWSGADNHSRNHAGHAMDIALIDSLGTALGWDDPLVQELTVEAARRGVRQLGAGPTYMKRYGEGRVPTQGDRIHIGGMTPGYDSEGRVRLWSDSDPEWGSDYSGGVTGKSEWVNRLQAAARDPVALGTTLPPVGGEQGWALVGGDASLYPGTLPEWLSPGQPTETLMAKNDPTAPVSAGYDLTGDPMRDGIIETANALGMDPTVLATIISYETGGTMDPMKPGPTTQWGQHRGLIQFGEPQAKQHGVDFSSPEAALASQFGPDGAIASYFRSSGWKPGMSELDAYSIVNAGGPGLYDRTDENNGGAPGTVRDKVEQQFGYHRDAARKLLQQVYAPTASIRPPSRPDSVPSTQPPGAATSGADDWVNPYNNRNLAMVGGVTGSGGLYHDWGSGNLWAHDNDYEDYSQFYREFTYEPKDGYVPVGERDGRTVYAAPAPEYVDGKPVDRNLYVSEARRRNALIPTENEMRALYEQAQAVPMPTIPNGGGPNDRISFDNVPDGPWYGPKEFYRTNDSPALPTNFAEAMQDPRVARALMQQILLGG